MLYDEDSVLAVRCLAVSCLLLQTDPVAKQFARKFCFKEKVKFDSACEHDQKEGQ
jgi:hypothetical protein